MSYEKKKAKLPSRLNNCFHANATKMILSITTETGTKLRYADTISSIAASTEFSLYSVNQGTLTAQATVNVPGTVMEDENCVDQYEGNFRIILSCTNNAEDAGSYENAEGKEVTLNDAFSKEGFTQPSPPDLSKYVKSSSSLFIFDKDLNEIGSIPDITSLWIDSISFNGNTAVLSTQNGSITLDLSNPAAPVKK